jgi:HSP20 family protein
MDIKKLAPWNWFKKEEEGSGAVVPVKRQERQSIPEDTASHPMIQLQQEMDRLFERAVRGFGLSPLSNEWLTPLTASGLLRPQIDVAATDKEYSITVEVPGVSEKDVKIEIAHDTMTIRGEKRQEKEEKEKNYYRVERSYGSFQRVLSLPGDANQDDVKATFKNGVLSIKMPRKALPKTDVKKIEIR